MPYVVSKRESIRYDGTNASYIADTWLTGSTIESTAPDGTIKLWYNSTDFEYIAVGSYILRQAGAYYAGTCDAASYAAAYIEVTPAV